MVEVEGFISFNLSNSTLLAKYVEKQSDVKPRSCQEPFEFFDQPWILGHGI
jgi:hypothetical protein